MAVFGDYKKDATIHRELKFSANGADVKALQTALIAAGYSVGNCGVDGKFGDHTLAAWKKFEKLNNSFKADGIANISELTVLMVPAVKPSVPAKTLAPIKLDSLYVAPFAQETTAVKQNLLLKTFAPLSPSLVDAPAPSALANKTVVIDIGHVGFGNDKGAPGILNGKSVTEADINSAIAAKVIIKLETAGVTVITSTGANGCQYSRAENLASRAQLAEDKNADLFVSIHTDSRPAGCYKGPAIYYLNHENENESFAKNLKLELGCREFTDQNFKVLKDNKGERPAVLIEVGDIKREARLVNEQYQDDLATQIANGIISTLKA